MSALDYNPPHDLEAEKALLGSLLLNSKLLEEVADKLKPDYFVDRKNQIVYQIILDLWLNSQPVDVLFVLNALQNNLRFNAAEVGTINREYLLELIAKSSLSSSPEHTARIIKEKYILRMLIRVGDNLKTLVVESNSPVEDILDNAQKQLYEIALDNLDKNFVRIGDLLTSTFERINELYTYQEK